MSGVFFNKSREIANNFLQNIVFLDDRAFNGTSSPNSQQNNSQHEFNSFEISKVFAKEQKICAVYNPTTDSDIEDFKKISKKADVVILDWFIEINNVVTEENSEHDEDEEDPRGKYTKQIIHDLVEQSGVKGLKLVVIYTGEDILEDITNNIHQEISGKGFDIDKDNCEVYSSNIKILVRAKFSNEDDNRFEQRPHLKNKILKYEKLPSFILDELTKMTSGLMSNFALMSLSKIRENSNMILGLFSRELDASYLAHRAVLPIQNDSENLLINLFGDTISDLLHYSSVSETIQTQFLDEWIDQNINDEEFAVTETKKFNRTKELLKALMHSETENIETRFKSLFESSSLKNAEKKLYYESKSTELFLNVSQHGKKDRIDSEFAKLTHHKSLFLPKSIAPVLTLGTIIKSKTNENNYYVCIQQRCDSVRISNGDERKFLFLPLIKVDDERLFHFITQNGIKLRLDKKSYSIKTIKFKCNNSRGVIEAEEDSDGVFIYKENYDNGDTYEWQLDLKDLHSQRIVTDYATNLARVGLDESEWLRRAGNN